MNAEFCNKLEEAWKNGNKQLSYDVWRSFLEKEYKNHLRQQLPDLAKSIVTDSGLFTHLQSKRVLDRRTIEGYKQLTGKYAQMSAILNDLTSKPFENFIRFCECLIETNQIHIIRDYLTPPHLGVNIDIRSEDELQIDLLGVKLRQEDIHETPSFSAKPIEAVDFDWRSLMRKNFPSLVNEINPDGELVTELISKGVLNEINVDVFMSHKGRSNRVEAILNHLMLSRPDEDFVKFCHALTTTNQDHVVKQYLSKESVHTQPQQQQQQPLPRSPAYAGTEQPRLVVPVPRNLQGDEWKKILIERRSSIVDTIDASEELISHLLRLGVMNKATAERCQEESDDAARAEFILDYMYRRSDSDYMLFLEALITTGQRHVVDLTLNSPTGDISDGV